MATISHSVELDRPPGEAFEFITDPSHFDEWQDAVTWAHLEQGPMGEGARIAMRRRIGPRQQDLTTEVTEFAPPRSYRFRGVDGPVRAIGHGTIEPIDEGRRSRFTFEIDFEGHGLGRIMLPLVRRQARKEVEQTHRHLARRLSA